MMMAGRWSGELAGEKYLVTEREREEEEETMKRYVYAYGGAKRLLKKKIG